MNPRSLQYLAYWLLELVASHTLLVDVELVEEAVVQEASGVVCCLAVERFNVLDEAHGASELLRADRECCSAGVSVGLDAQPIHLKLSETRSDLLLRQALFGQVDESIFAAVEFSQALGQRVVELTEGRLLVA